MTSKTTEFLITVHAKPCVIEVVYPSHPTLESYARYETAVRAAIEKVNGDWNCLVDQRALKVAPPEISERLSQLNAWARDTACVAPPASSPRARSPSCRPAASRAKRS